MLIADNYIIKSFRMSRAYLFIMDKIMARIRSFIISTIESPSLPINTHTSQHIHSTTQSYLQTNSTKVLHILRHC